MPTHRSNPGVAHAAKEPAHRAGDEIAGRYVLGRLLGEGGMGVVWVARSKALDVDVALKLLHSSAADSVAAERMAREAHAVARLGHAAIVRVLDFGETENGQPFMAMELLEGEDLARVLGRQGSLTAIQAVSLLLPVIDGLSAAHRHGIVHRDLKPENIFLARDEFGRVEPKVLDFGIAKIDMGADKRLTQVGAVLGSPAYLSPEQAEGAEDVDHRTDIWSVGVVLYHLITGQLPFDGKNYNALIRSITQDQPRGTADLTMRDEGLWKILRTCLRKLPADRFGSMRELGVALAEWLLEKGVTVDASSRSLRDAWLGGGASSVRGLFAPRPPGTTSPPPASQPGEIGFGTTRIRAKTGGPARRVARAGLIGLLGISLASGVAWVLTRGTQDRPLPGAALPAPAGAAKVDDRVRLASPPREESAESETRTGPEPIVGTASPKAPVRRAATVASHAAGAPAPNEATRAVGARPKPGAKPKNSDTDFGF